MKFRKKPVVIDALQWTGKNLDEVNKFIDDGLDEEIVPDKPFIIETLEGDVTCQVGDWIIRGIKGEFYPCKPDIFERSYDAVSTEPASPPF